MRITRATLALLLAGIGLATSAAMAGEERDVDYLRDVKPILTKRCTACHGVLQQKAGLRLDTAERLLQGGDAGPVVEPGHCDESPILDVLTGEGGVKMPPENEGEAVPAEEIALLRAWVAGGAKTPSKEPETLDPREHWSFRKPVRPAVPEVHRAAWAVNPIDAFLAARHEAKGLEPVAQADKATLLRRVFLDLAGIAPTPEEVSRFLAGANEDAYEQVVDQLLSSPRYGERWGRHWMDVWRYSDWDGYGAEVRESQPHIWRWRDWIIESLNEGKGYDRMVVEMLAADEAAPGDESALRATGYLARNWYKFNRNVWLDNIVEHTSKAFLGLTFNCARCHDHKYDPIAQTDYYRLRAFFEPHDVKTVRLPGEADPKKQGMACVYDAKLDAPTHLFLRGNEKEPDERRTLEPAMPRVLGGGGISIQPVSLPLETRLPGLKPFVREELLAQARREAEARKADLAKAAKNSPQAELASRALGSAQAALTAAEARVAADMAKHASPPQKDAELLARLAALAERQAAYSQAELALARAMASRTDAAAALKAKPDDAKAKQAAAKADANVAAAQMASDAAKAALVKTDGDFTPLGPTYPETSTGRRLALARWITSRDNPLTARVAINHVWMRHFGEPIVPTVFDFGNNGKAPSHPELLDWLAVEFMESGWNLKALHRMIVTSQVYRLRSTGEDASAANLSQDPENRELWRQNPRRMEAEAVRDNVLAAAGTLDPTMGGPDLDPAGGETVTRKSLYFRHAKEKRVVFLKLFDSPSVTSCYRRSESVVPQQALALVNSSLSSRQASVLAEAIGQEVGDDSSNDSLFVSRAFRRVLGRGPTAEEQGECLAFLANALKPAPGGQAPPINQSRVDLVHVLFNHNDFVTIR